MSRLTQIADLSLPEKARRAIQTAILDGTFEPGERVAIERIAEELGVSRTPVREALKALERDGLVSLEPHRGAIVKEFAPADLHHRYEIRAMIEGYAAELACEAASEDLVAQMAENCDEMAEVMETASGSERVRQLVTLNREFHDLVREACGSKTVNDLLGQLINPSTFTQLYWASLERQEESLDYHRQLVEAMRAKKPKRARKVLEKHLLSARDHLSELSAAPSSEEAAAV